MHTLTKLALTGLLAMAMGSTGAYAAQRIPGAGPPPPGNNNPPPGLPGTPPGGQPSNNCTVLCAPVTLGNADQVNYRRCGDRLSQLPALSREQVAAIGRGQRVHLAPLCNDQVNRTLTQAQVQYLEQGNVGGLVTAIAGNPTLAGKLGQGGYKAGDVLGILLGSNAVVLYVHKR